MKTSLPILCFAVILLAGCKHDPSAMTTQHMIQEPVNISRASQTSPPVCYESVANGDTCYLKTVRLPNAVTGLLNYSLHTHERQIGRFRGQLHGDTLIADYTYLLGDKSAVRQVAFLIGKDTVVEGHAPLVNQEGEMKFKDVNTLQFANGARLTPVECVHAE
jgi:hypothetical protein